MATKILSVLCALLSVLAAYLAYRIIDVSVALNDAASQYQLTLNEVDALRDFAVDLAKGKTRDEIRSRVSSRFGKDYLIKEDADGTIHLQDISFKFQNDQLIRIEVTTDSSRVTR